MISDKNYNKTKQNLESLHVNILYPFFFNQHEAQRKYQ